MKIVFVILFFLCNISFAEELNISSWNEVKDALKHKNIDPNQINWVYIDSICNTITSQNNSQKYNNCRFNMAVQLLSFEKDHNICTNDAKARFPDTMINQSKGSTTIHDKDSAGNTRTITISEGHYTENEINFERTNFYRNCMKNNGWKNPDDFKLGKSENFHK